MSKKGIRFNDEWGGMVEMEKGLRQVEFIQSMGRIDRMLKLKVRKKARKEEVV